MGWAAGGEIFDHVAHRMLEIKAPEDVVIETLAALADALTDRDWDTLDESVTAFLDQPVVVAGLRKGAPHWFEDDDWDATGDD